MNKTNGQEFTTKFCIKTLTLKQAVPFVNITEGDGVEVKTGTAGTTMAALPVFDGQKSVTSMSGGFPKRFFSSHRGDTMGVLSQPSGSGFYSDFQSRQSIEGDMFDGMALSYDFLGRYYNQVIAN